MEDKTTVRLCICEGCGGMNLEEDPNWVILFCGSCEHDFVKEYSYPFTDAPLSDEERQKIEEYINASS